MSAILTKALKNIVDAGDALSQDDLEVDLTRLYHAITDAKSLLAPDPTKPRVLAQHTVPGQFPVAWYLLPDGKYRVIYGAQSEVFNDSLSASVEFGTCVHSALECAGELDS